jgi:hypothetical protein
MLVDDVIKTVQFSGTRIPTIPLQATGTKTGGWINKKTMFKHL